MGSKPTTMKTKNVTKGAQGTQLSVEKYEAVKKAILAVVPRNKAGIAFRDLPKAIAPRLPRQYLPQPGSASWLATTVKLDLEARGYLERIPGVTPQRLRRVK
jgi:hypothetical protein